MQRGHSSGYGLGGPSTSPYGSTAYGAAAPQEQSGNFLDQIRPYTSKIEDALDTVSEPVKP